MVPDISVNITLVMPRELLNRIEEARKQDTPDENRSSFIRKLIEYGLEQSE